MLLIGGMLYSTGCTDYESDINDLNDKVDKLEQELVEGEIDPLKTDLAALEQSLNKAIEDSNKRLDEHKSAIEALQSADAATDARIDAAIEAIADNKTSIDEAAEAIAKAQKAISDNAEAIEVLKGVDITLAERLTTVEEQVKTNYDALKEFIDKNADDIKAVNSKLEGHINSFTTYKSEMAVTIATLESRVKAAEEAIEGLKTSVGEIKSLQQEQKELIDGLRKDHDALEMYAKDNIATLLTSVENLNTLVSNLSTSLETYKGEVEDEFVEVYGKIAENAADILELQEKLKKEIDDRTAADNAVKEELNGIINDLAGRVTTLETKYTELADELDEQIEEVKDSVKTLDEKVDGIKDELITKINTDVKKVADDLAAAKSELEGEIDDLSKKLTEYAEKTDKLLGELVANIDAILNRVQSIVFVPEYVDGKATINYAQAGNDYVESRSTLVYQVYPAECAALIANTPAIETTESPLTFLVTEPLKTRATDAASLTVVGVTADQTGKLFVTVEPRNLGEAFYRGEIEYAAAMVLKSETANLSTVYTNLVRGAAEQIKMAIMYPTVNGDVDVTNTFDHEPLTIQYVDTTTVKKILDGHYIEFTVGDNTYKGIEALKAAGYDVDMSVKYAPELEYCTPFKYVVNESGVMEVSVAELREDLIGQPVQFYYAYYVGDLSVWTGASVTTTPITANVAFDAVEAEWVYGADAAVDAAYHADETQTAVLYTRELDINVDTNTLPEDTTIENVFAVAPVSIKVNDVTLDDSSVMSVGFSAVDDNVAKLAIEGFEWGKEYTIEAKYELHNVAVIVTAKVQTIDRNRDAVTVDLAESTIDVVKNLKFTENNLLDVVYNKVAEGTKMGDFSAEAWLTDNFVANDPVATSTVAGVDCSSWSATSFIVAEDGQSIDAKYSYASRLSEKTDWAIPANLAYQGKYTTWYGQEIIVNKVVKFNMPKYDFAHTIYTKLDGDHYMSQVAPNYTFAPEGSDAISVYDVYNVDMFSAFNVIDADNKVLTAEQLAEAGLVVEYAIENDDETDGIYMEDYYKLIYMDSAAKVDVYGSLYVENEDGTRIKLTTAFDDVDKYGDYIVKNFCPIGEAAPTVREVSVDNAIEYRINVLENITLGDVRTGAAAINKASYALIENGAWVVGDGTNGFEFGKSVVDIYGLAIDWDWGEDSAPAEARQWINWDEATNELVFDNKTAHLELFEEFTVPVTLSIHNVWLEKTDIVVNVVFKPAQFNN